MLLPSTVILMSLVSAAPAAAAAGPLAPLKGALLNPIESGKVPGYPMDIAVRGSRVYMIVQSKQRGAPDLIYVYDKGSKRQLKTLALARNFPGGMTADGANLWVMNRRRSRFLCKYDLGGRLLASHARPAGAWGKLFGLAKEGDRFYFASFKGGRSDI